MVLHPELVMQGRSTQITVHDANSSTALWRQPLRDPGTHPATPTARFRPGKNHAPGPLGSQEQVLDDLANLVRDRSVHGPGGAGRKALGKSLLHGRWRHQRWFHLWLLDFPHFAQLR